MKSTNPNRQTTRSYNVVVNGEEFTDSFPTKKLAKAYLTKTYGAQSDVTCSIVKTTTVVTKQVVDVLETKQVAVNQLVAVTDLTVDFDE